MRTLEILNSTPKSRQLLYWRKEMESTHRRRNIYPKGSNEWVLWNKRYESACRTYEELSGVKMEVEHE